MVRIDVRSQRPRPARAASIGLAGALAAALALTACSSSSGSSSASASSGGSASTAGLSATASASAGLTAAQANVTKYSVLPTALNITRALPAAPTKGKSVVFLQCEVQQCTDGGNGFRAAAASVGWKVTTLGWKSTDPATLTADLQQALTMSPKPYAVSLSGLPFAIWGSQEAAYAKAHVLMIPWSMGPVTTNNTVIANVQGPEDVEFQGKLLADWFISDSHGTGKVLQQDIPQFPSIAEEGTGFRNEVAAQCPGCRVTKLDVTGTQVASNGVTPAIISALQRDPSIAYVAPSDIGLAPGLPAALKSAGLSRVKILGGEATAVDQQGVRDGTIAVVMQNNQTYLGWLQMDALVRHAAGISFPPNDGGLVNQIQTRATMPAAKALVPANFPELFKKLWHVG